MSRRWVCPSCGDSVLAPDRPRRDDVRRYCLPCSSASGRLTERTCPARDRQAAERAERRAARTITKRQRERSQQRDRESIGGVHLPTEAARLWRLPSMREPHRGRKPLPLIEIRRGTQEFSPGHAYGSRITMTTGSPGSTLACLLHELVHCAVGVRRGHDARFWETVRACAAEAWPEADFNFKDAPTRGWQLGQWIAARIPLPEEGAA